MNISTFNILLQFLRDRTELRVENENGTRKHTRKQNKKNEEEMQVQETKKKKNRGPRKRSDT